MSKLKTKATRKPDAADAGVRELLEAEQQRIRDERAAFESKYKPFKKKTVIADEKSLVDTVHRIAEWSGVGEMPAEEVAQMCELISTGQVHFTDGKLCYELQRAVQRGGKLLKQLNINEIPDERMEAVGVDAFQVGLKYITGRREEITSDTIRKIASEAVGLETEVVGRMNSRDIMTIYAVYMIFFLGR
jgi:hypothetical protein